MIDDFAQRIPDEVKRKSGKVFYSGRSAFSEPSTSGLYILGINPGGKPSVSPKDTIAARTERDLQRPNADWSAYRDESWGGSSPGRASLQRNVLHLLNQIGAEAHTVPASNVVFLRSRDIDELERITKRRYEEWAADCWNFHEAVINELGIKVVAVFGKPSGDYVRKRLKAHKAVGEFGVSFGKNRSKKQTSCTYKTAEGRLTVVTLWFPAVYGNPWWTNPDMDPTHLVVNALKGRG